MMSGFEAIAAASALDLLAFSPPGWGATLLAGLGNSVIIALGAYGLGFAIGLCGAFGKLYGGPVTKDLLAVYTTIVRAVPELVLILILFYAFTGLLNQALLSWGMDRVQISPIITGIVVWAWCRALIKPKCCAAGFWLCQRARLKRPARWECPACFWRAGSPFRL